MPEPLVLFIPFYLPEDRFHLHLTNIPDGDTVKISVLIDEDNRIVKQFEGTVKNGTVEIDWDILSKHFKKEE